MGEQGRQSDCVAEKVLEIARWEALRQMRLGVVRAARGRRVGVAWHRRGFRLDARFVKEFEAREPPFGFNGLGELVYHRTYARVKPNGKRERWFETVQRVVDGTFSMQERWVESNVLGWDQEVAQTEAQEMYRRIFDMKFLPPGRGLWCMGTVVTEERGLFAALNNCAFVSTDELDKSISEAFCFTMDASMLGVGVGFDTKGAGKVMIQEPTLAATNAWVVPDSRDGWVDSLKQLLESYVAGPQAKEQVVFDYSQIRPAGRPIKGFGGTSSGPGPLEEMHKTIRKVLTKHDGKPMSVTGIVDIMNLIGRCVVAGNVRRTAEIAFGEADSKEYIELKDYDVNPERQEFGWTSNNSVFATLGMDYSEVVKRVRKNGEPGFAWLDNMRNFGRMNGERDTRDWRAGGGNPCLEQTLESHELCCLVETFPHHHQDIDDYKKTLESAFLYAKTVTLGRTHWPKSNRVMLRNRRIGTSMSGIAQFVGSRGMHELREWAEAGYMHVQACDEAFSDRFCIPRSIKTTCIKPSGTVSLLAGATPGMHAPESRFYVRRLRVAKTNEELLDKISNAGFHIEDDVADANTSVVSFPIDAGEGVRTAKEVGMWEQLSTAAFLQKHWADNQVSCTVTFDDKTEGDSLVNALDAFQYQLKGVSFLPRMDYAVYAQMPYEEISEEEFDALSQNLKPLNLGQADDEENQDEEIEQERAKSAGASFNTKRQIHPQQLFNQVGIAQAMPDNFCDACVVGSDSSDDDAAHNKDDHTTEEVEEKVCEL